ncbi:hypothetical protein [uncultured Psychroserpens sp.]|uniref:hypothetical protein n=1 Tax=uncultured Psychroserpens sp. TaxID=255436 RepID=UPI002627871C|nr:hypothetical protein [uncultured Psychroserpens sp.]
MRELCFKLELLETITNQLNENYINEFIDFAIDNNVSLGGSAFSGFCFCVDEDFKIPSHLKTKFVTFLKVNYSKKIKAVHFQKYDENADEFINLEMIQINN